MLLSGALWVVSSALVVSSAARAGPAPNSRLPPSMMPALAGITIFIFFLWVPMVVLSRRGVGWCL